MNDGDLRNLERDLGRVVGVLEGVGRELSIMRDEAARREETYLKAIAEHDQRDDTRFSGVDREFAVINRALALREQIDQNQAASGLKWHNWQIAMIGVLGLCGSAVIGAATAHLMGP